MDRTRLPRARLFCNACMIPNAAYVVYLILFSCDTIGTMPYVLDFKNRDVQQQPPAAPPKTIPQQPAKPAEPKPVKHTEPTANTLPDAITWEAPEYLHIKKSPDWYWAVGILTVGIFVVALIFNNYLFGIFVLVGGFTVALYGARPPRVMRFTISGEGIRIENRVYPFETLKSFWIFYRPPDIKELSVESEKLIMPRIQIPLGDTNPVEVRAFLKQFLSEQQQEESLIDSVTRLLGY